MNEKTVSVTSGRFSVEVLEAGSGDDLLYLHGAGGLTWDPFLEALSERYHVIAPRTPGTGNSTGIENLLDHHDLFYFYLDFLDDLGLGAVNVMGHSMGGWFAAELAAMQPDRFKRVVLIDPIGLWNDDYPVLDIFAMLPNELVDAVFHDKNHPAAQMMLEVPTEEEAIKAAMIERTKNLSTAARYMWPIPDKGLKNRIHRITSPTLVLWGKSDKLAPVAYAADFGRAIKNSTVEVLDRSGHMPQLEQPEETLAKITAFLG